MLLFVPMNATNLITLSEACDLLPRKRGKKIHTKTVARWIVNGCRGVFLAGAKVGSEWFTSEAWLVEFSRKCSTREKTDAPGSAAASSDLAKRILAQRYGFNETKEEATALPNVPKAV